MPKAKVGVDKSDYLFQSESGRKEEFIKQFFNRLIVCSDASEVVMIKRLGKCKVCRWIIQRLAGVIMPLITGHSSRNHSWNRKFKGGRYEQLSIESN